MNKTKAKGARKTFSGIEIFFALVCAMLIANSAMLGPSMGTSSPFWFLLIGIIFFIPIALINSELASTYSYKGGIYIWVRRAFGQAWGARTAWFYIAAVMLMLPYVAVLFSGALKAMFFSEGDIALEVLIAVAFVWVVLLLSNIKLARSKWVITVSAVIKIAIFALIIATGIIYLVNVQVPANSFTTEALLPKWDESLAFIPVIVLLCLGTEIMSSNAKALKNPKKTMPKAIIVTAVLCIVLYAAASISTLFVVPQAETDITSGIFYMLMATFGYSNNGYYVVCILLITLFAQAAVWVIGRAKSAFEAGANKELPAFFAKKNKRNGAPMGSFLIIGVASTVLLIVYGALQNASPVIDISTWIFKTGAILMMIPYLMMLPAFIKLRKTDTRTRAFKAPIGRVLAVLCMVVLICAIVLLVWVPSLPFDVQEAVPVIIGVFVALFVGELLMYFKLRESQPMAYEKE